MAWLLHTHMNNGSSNWAVDTRVCVIAYTCQCLWIYRSLCPCAQDTESGSMCLMERRKPTMTLTSKKADSITRRAIYTHSLLTVSQLQLSGNLMDTHDHKIHTRKGERQLLTSWHEWPSFYAQHTCTTSSARPHVKVSSRRTTEPQFVLHTWTATLFAFVQIDTNITRVFSGILQMYSEMW